MCGIIGAFGSNYKSLSKESLGYLINRGPDGQDSYSNDNSNLFLGHTRLSIIDLSSGSQQPMFDDSGRYAMVFNGEIYNYRTLRDDLQGKGYQFITSGDSEVVLNLYIEYKEKSLTKLRGMFAFAIFDLETNSIFLARDRFGIKPLIYAFIEGTLYFCSETNPLLHSTSLSKELSDESVFDFFKFGSVQQPRTIYKELFSLMPGNYMLFDGKGVPEIKSYYKLQEQLRTTEKDFTTARNTLRDKLFDATKMHMVADVEVGAFLSGGVDSTAAVALMNEVSSSKINTFSLGFDFESGVADETEIAQRSAKFLGTNHETIRLNEKAIIHLIDAYVQSIDQPCYDGINTFIISSEVGKKMKVAISGLGGDEIFSGYSHFKLMPEFAKKNKSLFSHLISKHELLFRRLRINTDIRFYGCSFKEQLELRRSVSNPLEVLYGSFTDPKAIDIWETPFDSNSISDHQRISLLEFDGYLLNTILRDGDVLSMAASLELRPVLLDHELVEYAINIDDSLKIKDGIQKYIFIKAVEDLIPNEVWQRKKTGFSMPFAKWLNGPLNHEFCSLLKEANALYTKLNNDYISKLLKRANNQSLQYNDWALFIFLKWLKVNKNNTIE